MKFDKNVPLPPSNSKWVWLRSMKVGDSKFVTGVASSRVLTGILFYYRPLRFTIEKRIENGKAGHRIWRIKEK